MYPSALPPTKHLPGQSSTPCKPTSTSPPPIPAPAPIFCPVVETPMEPSNATAPAIETPEARCCRCGSSPLTPTLPPLSQQIDNRARGDEVYPEPMEWQHAQQVQQTGKPHLSFSSTSLLQTIPEENQESICAFAAAESTARPEKWSAKIPTRPFVEEDGGSTEGGTKPAEEDHGTLKENIAIRNTKVVKDEDESGMTDDEEKRFI